MPLNKSQNNTNDSSNNHSSSRFSEPIRDYIAVTRECLSDWQTDLGLIFNGFALFAFIVALIKLGLSEVFSKIFQYYRQIASSLFWPFEHLFEISVPGYVQDAILFWSVSGAIGARTMLWIYREFYNSINATLQEAEDPNTISHIEKLWGKSKVDQEIQWMLERKEFFKITRLRKVVMYVGCLITGPMFFYSIWKEVAPVPGRRKINGRTMIIVQVLTLLAVLGVFFTLNWVTL